MMDWEENTDSTDVPHGFREVAQCIESFVRVNYDAALAAGTTLMPSPEDIALLNGKILDIIRHNPPLASIPRYLKDNREDYLWYSDFYDEVTREVYHRYRTFNRPEIKITPASYTEELAKIDLPYFAEIVSLVSLERLRLSYQKRGFTDKGRPKEEYVKDVQAIVEKADSGINSDPVPISNTTDKPERIQTKRSYEPKLSAKEYALLSACIEAIRLFRYKITVPRLRKLLNGKPDDPLQVANQKSLVYLFDELKKQGYIKDTWVSVAEGNKDFISFRTRGNERRYGSKPHFITMQQLLNSRNRNRREAIHGIIEIDELMEQLEEYREKQ
jgi:hypothetical protein